MFVSSRCSGFDIAARNHIKDLMCVVGQEGAHVGGSSLKSGHHDIDCNLICDVM